ncbi:MAG: hypothetical protein AAB657_03120 [Patescibacteria group bacterium]
MTTLFAATLGVKLLNLLDSSLKPTNIQKGDILSIKLFDDFSAWRYMIVEIRRGNNTLLFKVGLMLGPVEETVNSIIFTKHTNWPLDDHYILNLMRELFPGSPINYKIDRRFENCTNCPSVIEVEIQ